MVPQGVPDVVVPLEALPQEVLDGFNQPFMEDGQPPTLSTILMVPPPAFLAHDCVPPVEAGSAYAPQTMSAPVDNVNVADETPSQSSSARRFVAINDRLYDESVDHDAVFGPPTFPVKPPGFLRKTRTKCILWMMTMSHRPSLCRKTRRMLLPPPPFHPDFDDDEILVLESIDREQVLVGPLVFRQACK